MRFRLQNTLYLMVLFTVGAMIPGTGYGWQEESGKETASAAAKEKAPAPREATDFLRIQTDEYGSPIALQTATAKYVLEDDNGEVQLEVSLESVIHIADSSYYRGFQSRFGRYDVVLFESLLNQSQQTESSEETDMPSGFEMFQQLSCGTLGLAYQFDEVEYENKNLRNADLSMKEISERLADRGDNQTTLFSDLLAHILKRVGEPQPQVTEAGADSGASTEARDVKSPLSELKLSILTDPDGIMKIRRLMAAALVNSRLLESTYPPSIQKIIVGDRNDRVMSVLNSEREKGNRNVAVFFGVSHMADLEKRLVDEYGMKLKSVNWRNAWDLRDGAVEGAPLEGLIESTFKDSFKNKLQNFARGLRNKPKEEDKKAAQAAADAAAEKDRQIEEMQKMLKAMQSRLEEVEGKSDKKKGEEDKGDGKGTGQYGDKTESGQNDRS